ncbi:MAG: hypothetical protein WC964_00505 [Acholeplasmataceae bacterium]
MKLKVVQLLVQILIIITYFFPMFYPAENGDSISGFNALFHPGFMIYGNILIIFVLLLTIYRLVYSSLNLVIPTKIKKMEDLTTGLIIIQMIAAILMVTLLGLRLDWMGMVLIGLVAGSVFLEYKGKNA